MFENAILQRTTPKQKYVQLFYTLILIYFNINRTIFFVFFYSIERINMPLINDEKDVMITHVLGTDLIYVQLSSYFNQFNQFQFTDLQNVNGLQQIKSIPGKIT